MRTLQVLFIALVLLTAANAYSRSHTQTETHAGLAVTAADPIPLCPRIKCPTQPPPTN